jgi:hypothetical protein
MRSERPLSVAPAAAKVTIRINVFMVPVMWRRRFEGKDFVTSCRMMIRRDSAVAVDSFFWVDAREVAARRQMHRRPLKTGILERNQIRRMLRFFRTRRARTKTKSGSDRSSPNANFQVVDKVATANAGAASFVRDQC